MMVEEIFPLRTDRGGSIDTSEAWNERRNGSHTKG
jgi:hypothetical protein